MLNSQKPSIWTETLTDLMKAGDITASIGPTNEHVFRMLRISYDALGLEQRQMFLDVACSMLSWHEYAALAAWKRCTSQLNCLAGRAACSNMVQ